MTLEFSNRQQESSRCSRDALTLHELRRSGSANGPSSSSVAVDTDNPSRPSSFFNGVLVLFPFASAPFVRDPQLPDRALEGRMAEPADLGDGRRGRGSGGASLDVVCIEGRVDEAVCIEKLHGGEKRLHQCEVGNDEKGGRTHPAR